MNTEKYRHENTKDTKRNFELSVFFNLRVFIISYFRDNLSFSLISVFIRG